MTSGRKWIVVAIAAWIAGSPGWERRAWAHSWYPTWCCSDHDCRELLAARGETVTETADGFRLWDGRFIEREYAKPSQDIRFHICEEPVTRAIVCFFAPQGQS